MKTESPSLSSKDTEFKSFVLNLRKNWQCDLYARYVEKNTIVYVTVDTKRDRTEIATFDTVNERAWTVVWDAELFRYHKRRTGIECDALDFASLFSKALLSAKRVPSEDGGLSLKLEYEIDGADVRRVAEIQMKEISTSAMIPFLMRTLQSVPSATDAMERLKTCKTSHPETARRKHGRVEGGSVTPKKESEGGRRCRKRPRKAPRQRGRGAKLA